MLSFSYLVFFNNSAPSLFLRVLLVRKYDDGDDDDDDDDVDDDGTSFHAHGTVRAKAESTDPPIAASPNRPTPPHRFDGEFTGGSSSTPRCESIQLVGTQLAMLMLV